MMGCLSHVLLSVLTFTSAGINVHAAAAAKPPRYDGFNVTDVMYGSVPSNTSFITNYTCILYSLWSQTRHPAFYPSNPTFFTPFLVAHSSDYQLWANGSIATSGLKNMVQTGATDPIIREVNSATTSVLGWEEGSEQNVLLLLQQTLPSLQVDKDHSYLTSVTPFSPSPDWFHGFFQFNTIDTSTKTFLESFAIEVFPWDLGTKTGDTYTDIGSALSPYDPIKEFTNATIPSSDVFLDPSRTQLLPVARWTCDLLVESGTTTTNSTDGSSSPSSLVSVLASVTPACVAPVSQSLSSPRTAAPIAPTNAPIARTSAGTSVAKWMNRQHLDFVAAVTLMRAMVWI